MNLTVPKKDQTIEEETIKSPDLKNKRALNGSGFFVFNEEDMKSMTEMSPKNAKHNT